MRWQLPFELQQYVLVQVAPLRLRAAVAQIFIEL